MNFAPAEEKKPRWSELEADFQGICAHTNNAKNSAQELKTLSGYAARCVHALAVVRVLAQTRRITLSLCMSGTQLLLCCSAARSNYSTDIQLCFVSTCQAAQRTIRQPVE